MHLPTVSPLVKFQGKKTQPLEFVKTLPPTATVSPSVSANDTLTLGPIVDLPKIVVTPAQEESVVEETSVENIFQTSPPPIEVLCQDLDGLLAQSPEKILRLPAFQSRNAFLNFELREFFMSATALYALKPAKTKKEIQQQVLAMHKVHQAIMELKTPSSENQEESYTKIEDALVTGMLNSRDPRFRFLGRLVDMTEKVQAGHSQEVLEQDFPELLNDTLQSLAWLPPLLDGIARQAKQGDERNQIPQLATLREKIPSSPRWLQELLTSLCNRVERGDSLGAISEFQTLRDCTAPPPAWLQQLGVQMLGDYGVNFLAKQEQAVINVNSLRFYELLKAVLEHPNKNIARAGTRVAVLLGQQCPTLFQERLKIQLNNENFYLRHANPVVQATAKELFSWAQHKHQRRVAIPSPSFFQEPHGDKETIIVAARYIPPFSHRLMARLMFLWGVVPKKPSETGRR